MRWNQYGNEPERAKALGEVLLGATVAGGIPTDMKVAVVEGQVMKALGVTILPPEIATHLCAVDPVRIDLASACTRLRPESSRERMAVMKAISVVINADAAVKSGERAYALRVATELGVPWNDVLDLIGMPHRPTTGPRPRPALR